MRNPVEDLRIVGFVEGMSYLILLFVAMPLKYGAGLPLAVRIVGAIHGGLFVLYVAAALRAARSRRWTFLRLLEALWASLYPFGTFVFDRKLRAELVEEQTT
jgi:integral membrane protein